jgi:WhiB family transcriptional regulator, redox-sensing transcriptional regulator
MDFEQVYGSRDVSWMDEAACLNVEDKDIFFPPRDKTQYRAIADEAKNYCLGPNRNRPCPVRAECLWLAIEDDEQHGIWGGLSHRERNAMVRKWQKKYKHQMSLKQYIFSLDKRE